MVHRHLEQQELQAKEKRKEKEKNMPKTTPKGRDGTCWFTNGQCSFEDSCAFTHEPNKKVKGKGRPRSLYPTGSPHRNSKGGGKGNDDVGAQGTPKHIVKYIQGERTDSFVLKTT